MERRRPEPLHHLLTTLALAAVAVAAWAGWLGWDQTKDVQPDGTTTGPYEAWQVIGLVLTLAAPLYWAASRHHYVAAVAGLPLGLAAAALYDWSDDGSGLFLIGVFLVLGGSFAATAAVTGLIAALKQNGPPTATGPSAPQT
jgi:peptidoglycan/LPS O-acetylase OafA/YrhL